MPGRYFTRPRGNRGLGAVIHSQKNIRKDTQALAANAGVDIATAVEPKNLDLGTNPEHVLAGSRIYRIWVEIWVYGTLGSGVNNPYDWYFWKNPAAAMTSPIADQLDSNDEEKNYVFRLGKGLLGRLVDGSPPYHIGPSVAGFWLKVPKKMQRMNIGDKLQLVHKSAGANYCANFIYKAYS